jgi:hypothetical protein
VRKVVTSIGTFLVALVADLEVGRYFETEKIAAALQS